MQESGRSQARSGWRTMSEDRAGLLWCTFLRDELGVGGVVTQSSVTLFRGILSTPKIIVIRAYNKSQLDVIGGLQLRLRGRFQQTAKMLRGGVVGASYRIYHVEQKTTV